MPVLVSASRPSKYSRIASKAGIISYNTLYEAFI
jgi:hypothetical protein